MKESIMHIAIQIQEELFKDAYHAAQKHDSTKSEVIMTLRGYLALPLSQNIYLVDDKRQLATNLKAACHIAYTNEYHYGQNAPEYTQKLSHRAHQIIDNIYQNEIVNLIK